MDLDTLLTHHLEKAWDGETLFALLRPQAGDLSVVDRRVLIQEKVDRVLEDGRQVVQWQALCLLQACAEIATLSEAEADLIPTILAPWADRGLLTEKPESVSGSRRCKDAGALRSGLENYIWPNRHNASWAWDAVRQFKAAATGGLEGAPQAGVLNEAEIIVPLYEEEGCLARLILRALAGCGELRVFPDPRFMPFVEYDADFLTSLEQAIDYVCSSDLLNARPEFDVRWRIQRTDDMALYVLKGSSAGAAFALTLSRLLAALTPEAN